MESARQASDWNAKAGSRQLQPDRYELTTSVPPRCREAGGSAAAQTVSLAPAASALGLLPISIESVTCALARSSRKTLDAGGLATQIPPPEATMLETPGATGSPPVTEPVAAAIFETVPSRAFATQMVSPSTAIPRGPFPTGIV